MTKAKNGECTLYATRAGRKVMLSLVFLALLPFFMSLPAMFWQRLSNGIWLGTPGLIVLGAAFTGVMAILLFNLIYALRCQVELGDDAVRFTLPAGRGPTPVMRYKTHEIPYDDVLSVEGRREIYGGALAPTLLTGTRIITRDGTKIPLGYVSEQNMDACFPFPVIGAQIARRAGIAVADKGTVHRSVHRKMLGIVADAQENVPVSEAEVARLNQRHRYVVIGLIAAMVLLLGLGMLSDGLAPSGS